MRVFGEVVVVHIHQHCIQLLYRLPVQVMFTAEDLDILGDDNFLDDLDSSLVRFGE